MFLAKLDIMPYLLVKVGERKSLNVSKGDLRGIRSSSYSQPSELEIMNSDFLALEMMLVSINSAWVKALLKEGKQGNLWKKGP
jgi:hypothetical protein